MKPNKGITLIALVITIVVLLILTGITIGYVLNDNSIFKQAEEARLKTNIKSWQERLELAKDPNIIEGLGIFDPDKYFEDIEKQGMINNKEDDVKDNEDGTYEVITKPGYVFQVELVPTTENPKDVQIEYLGKVENLGPVIKEITVIEKSSNSIIVEVTIERLGDGKLSYYYKKENEEIYHELEGKRNTNDLTAEFTDLEQNQIYNIKVEVKNKKGTAEAEISEITGELRTGTISQKGEAVWSNGKANIELETNPSDLKLEYQVNGIEGTWSRYEGAIGNLDHKDRVYARITDGTNVGEIATVEIRDGGLPVVIIGKGAVSTNSIGVTVTATDNQWGMPVSPTYSYFIKKSTDSSYPIAKYTGEEANYTFTGLTQNTSYDIKVTTKDKAENGGTGILVNITTGTVGGTNDNLSTGNITASSPVWNNTSHTASVTLSTTTDLQIQWQKNGISGTWTTVAKGTKSVTIPSLNHNDKIYARLYDGVNAGSEAYVAIRDGIAPIVTVTKGTVSTNSIGVTVTSADNQWGMPANPSYSYFIKKSTENTYPTAKYTGTNTNYTFTGLTQNTSYDIKVTTKDKANNEGVKVLTVIKTGTVGGASGNLATGNITASSPTWSGGKASVTLSTTTNLQIQWQKNGISGTWTTVAKGTKSVVIPNLNHNDKIYARLYDGVNSGSEAYVQIKDGTKPTNATITLGATTANTGVNVTAKVTHNDAQSGVKITSCKWVYNTTASKIGTTASSYTGGTFSSNGQTLNLKATAPGTYYLHILTTDNANNVWETVSGAVTVKQLATGVTVSPTTATILIGKTQQLTATVTPTNTSNKGIKWTTSNSTIATVSTSGLVTAKAAGTATITVTTTDGSNKSATCKVTVKSALANIVNQVQTSNKAVTDDNGNKVVIPGGFKVVANGTGDVTYSYLGNGQPSVQDGIVIQDNEGNQFVWIPVGNIKNKDGTTTTITLGRYTFNGTNGTPILKQNADNYTQVVSIDSYQELTRNSGNTAAKNLEDFITKTKVNGGYYLGRYEASYKDSTHCYSKKSTSTKTSSSTALTAGMLWHGVSQRKAATVARNSFNNSYVESDLINSYSWDTAIVFIQKYSGNTNYANKKSVNKSLANTGVNNDKVCNIHDMASNCLEWSTETSKVSNKPCVQRGGCYNYDDHKTDHRGYCSSSDSAGDRCFRSILYIK